jgi:hypothetical protein
VGTCFESVIRDLPTGKIVEGWDDISRYGYHWIPNGCTPKESICLDIRDPACARFLIKSGINIIPDLKKLIAENNRLSEKIKKLRKLAYSI